MGSFSGALGTLFVEIDARVDDAIKAFDQIENAVDDVGERFAGMQKVGEQMAGIGAGLTAAVTLPLVGVGAAAVKTAEDLNTARVSFTTMLGSAEAADKMLKDLQAFAATTPFEFPDLVHAATRMKALGFNANEVVPMLKTVGDAAAALGGGKDAIDGITKALGDMRSKGKVSAEEMQQLAERGIPAWEILAGKIGVSIPEAMKMAEKGALQASTAVPALLAGMNERFGGQMEQMSKTLTGQWSNLKDTLTAALIPIGQALIPALQSLMPVLQGVVAGIADIAQWFLQLPGPVQAAIGTLAGLAAALGPVLLAIGGITTAIGAAMPALTGLAGFFGVSVAALAPWALAIGAVLAALVALGVWVHDNWEPITAVLKQAWEGVEENWTAVWNAISGAVLGVWNAISDAVSKVWEPIAKFFSVIWDGITKYFGSIWDGIAKGLSGVWEGIKSVASRVWNAIIEVFQDFLKWAGKIPGANKLLNLDEAWKSAGNLKTKMDSATTSVKSFDEAAGKAAGSSSAAVPKLAKATKETGDAAEKTASQVKPLRETSELLIATQKLLNAEHEKHVKNLAASQIEMSKWKDWVQQMIAPADDLFDSLKAINTELTGYATKHGPDALAKITEINAEIPKQTTAVTNLGTASRTAYTDIATHAGTAHAAVKGDTSKVGQDAISLSFKGWKETATDLKTAVPNLIDGMLGDLGTTITNKLPSLTGPFGDLKTAATGAIGSFVTDAAKMLFDGDASWGEKLKSLLGTLGTAVKNIFVEPAKDALNDLMNGVLKDLISGDKGFSGLKDAVKGVGDIFTGIFGKGGSIEKDAANASGAIGGIGGSGGAGGGGGGAAGTAGAAAGAGLAGIVGAVAGVVTAISSVIGNFQMAKMETTLNAIEHETRYSQIHLLHILEDGVNKYLPKLDQINGYLWDHFNDAFASLMSTTEDILTAVGKFQFPLDWTMKFTDMNRQTLYEIRDALYDISGYLLTTRDNTTMMKDKFTGAQTWTVQFAGDPIASMIGSEIMRQLRLQGVNLV